MRGLMIETPGNSPNNTDGSIFLCNLQRLEKTITNTKSRINLINFYFGKRGRREGLSYTFPWMSLVA